MQFLPNILIYSKTIEYFVSVFPYWSSDLKYDQTYWFAQWFSANIS